MVVFAGQGDPRRSMALLWRTEPARTKPGPKPGLTVDEIVDAAIAIADADGMAALSMRAVGERLGRTAMSLYTYVPSKSELVDLMYDRALGELPTDYDLTAGWRPVVQAWAEGLRDFYLRHPWMLQVSAARPVLGPNEFTLVETGTRILRETGLEAKTLSQILGTLSYFVRGAAQAIAESRQAPSATGVSETDWWYARSDMLAEVAPDFADRFPNLTWMDGQGAYQNEDESAPYLEQEARETFEAGLTMLLDGIAATIPA